MATVATPSWLTGHLDAGEDLRWHGISGGRYYRAFPLFSAIVSLFGLLFAGTVLTMGILVVATNPTGADRLPLRPGELSPTNSLLISVVFALVGLSFVVGPWVMHRVVRWQIGYAVTTKRALMIRFRVGRKAQVVSYPAEKINVLVVREYPDGYGNVWISSETEITKNAAGITWRGFLDAPDVRGLAQALSTLTNISPEIRRAFFAWLFRA